MAVHNGRLVMNALERGREALCSIVGMVIKPGAIVAGHRHGIIGFQSTLLLALISLPGHSTMLNDGRNCANYIK